MLHIFDIDGVLADDRHRVHHALNKRWAHYFNTTRMAADTVWPQGEQAVQAALAAGHEIAYLTGRREDRRTVTQKWLTRHGFPEAPLRMRPLTEGMPLAQLKVQMLRDHAEPFVLFDDDPVVVEAVREAFGHGAAVHCTWHIKPMAIVSKATA